MKYHYEVKEIMRSTSTMSYEELKRMLGYVIHKANKSHYENDAIGWEVLAYEISNRIEKLELECVG